MGTRKPPRIRQSSANTNTISRKTNLVINAFFIVYSILCILPFLLILAISLSDEASIVANGYQLIPERLSTAAYEYILRRSTSILRSYGITIYATVAGTALSLVITILFAYPLSRKDFKYRNIFAFIVFFAMIFNAGMVAGYMVYTQLLHLKNNLLVYLVPFLFSGWNCMLMRTFITNSIPDSLIEAARIDGAGELTAFLKIVLPLSVPGIATLALMTSIAIWNDWYTPLLYVTDAAKQNLQYSMYRTLNDAEYLKQNMNVAGSVGLLLKDLPTQSIRMAMCIVAVGPIILIYPFFQKHFVKGLVIGAVKG